jgi:hypothetical protein
LDKEEEEIAPVEMITCGTRCEPDASGPSDQSTAAAAPYVLVINGASKNQWKALMKWV